MLILCLCREEHHWKLIPGYVSAFRRLGIDFRFVDDSLPLDTPLERILSQVTPAPDWIFHFESAHPLLPQDLQNSQIPTVTFQADTYAFTRKRIRWSSLFDHVVVFHAGYDRIFQDAGHSGAFLLPHAVRREFFEGPELSREFELGWVGQSLGVQYARRAAWLPKLASEFKMNDWSQKLALHEVADMYRRSRIVVNIGRDDFPQDANLRVFEVLASGALLITSLPTELTEFGFQEGVHFAGYRHDSELLPLVRRYLDDETSRSRISASGRSLVLREHTYDARATRLLAHLEQTGKRKLAPARTWSESHARLMALDFFASHAVLPCAISQFRRIVGHGFRETIEAAFLLSLAFFRARSLG